jgi:hypothetical protein
MDLTIQSSQLTIGDRNTFASTVDGISAQVSIGGTSIDSLSLSRNGSGGGSGRLKWTARNGTVRYQIRNADLSGILAGFGATDMDGSASVSVPFVIQLGSTAYTATYNFSYTARQGKFGQGK